MCARKPSRRWEFIIEEAIDRAEAELIAACPVHGAK
jgi:hypothetical protein